MTQKEFVQQFMINAAQFLCVNDTEDYVKLHGETPVSVVAKLAEDAWDYIEG